MSNNTTTRYNEVSTFTWYHVSRYHSYLFVKKFQNRSSYIFLPFPTINPSTYIQKLKKILASNLKTQVSMTLHQSRKCHSIEYPNFNDRSSTSLNRSKVEQPREMIIIRVPTSTAWHALQNTFDPSCVAHRVARLDAIGRDQKRGSTILQV